METRIQNESVELRSQLQTKNDVKNASSEAVVQPATAAEDFVPTASVVEPIEPIEPIAIPKFIIYCKSGCIDVSQHACIGGYKIGKLKFKRPWAETRQWNVSNLKASNIHKMPGDTLGIYTGQTNINHALHDDLWSGLVWAHQLKKDKREFSVVLHATNPWAEQFLSLFDRTFDLNALVLPSGEPGNATICAESHMYLNGFMRKIFSITPSQVLEIRNDMRKAAVSNFPKGILDNQRRKKQVVIYTRKDSLWRQIEELEPILDLFDGETVNVSIVPSLPSKFYDQVQLFSSSDLLVAPNGGWSPNVLWMKDDACLTELHFEKEDSWIKMFGLSNIFEKGHFATVTGNFRFPNATKVKRGGRNKRDGKDGTFSGERLAPALLRALRCSHAPPCALFLKKNLREMEYKC
ncbi:MAG: hypothetical protein SGBAC_011517 [Bacillariaceae sp.]